LSDPPPRWPVPRPAPGREAWAAAAPIVRTGTRAPAEADPRMYSTHIMERKVEERSSPLRRTVIRVSPYSPLCGSAFPGYAPSKALLSHPCGEVCVSYGFLWHWLTGPMCCHRRQIRNKIKKYLLRNSTTWAEFQGGENTKTLSRCLLDSDRLGPRDLRCEPHQMNLYILFKRRRYHTQAMITKVCSSDNSTQSA